MKKNRTQLVAAIAAVMCAGVCLAGHHRPPAPGGHRGPGPRPAPMMHRSLPPPPHRHHHHHHGGSGFVGGVVGGIVGGLLYDAVTTPTVTYPSVVVSQPVVVTPPAPVYQTQNVWVPGCYVNQVLANGTVVRVWQPGHYEQRTVVVQ